MKKTVSYLVAFFIVILLTGCGKTTTNETNDSDKLKIYTTVYPLQYFAQEIGQEFVSVESIYPPGSDEHTYEPTQKEMMALADSDLFIYVGLGLEGFVRKAEKALQGERVQFFPAGEQLNIADDEHSVHHDDHENEHEDEHDGHSHGDIDPHVWIDPVYAIQIAESIKNKLIEMLPNEQAQFEENYLMIVEKLENLNKQFEGLANEAKRKEFIVSHRAYGYLEKRYGFKQLSIAGLSSSSEPSQKELERIVQTVKDLGINYIFYEQNTVSRTTDVIQNELGLEKLLLHNLSVLTESDIKEGRNYFSIMEDNIEALKKALND